MVEESDFIEKAQKIGGSLYILIPKEHSKKANIQAGEACAVRIAKIHSPFQKEGELYVE